eukprot:TRINITY_DN3862_c0_g3_i1.p1 TRINITY_DN3862_c0_g3~~TRINITY_DN3862_c0_g3_i1.p1  ORF type:complete len:423 (-),score=121.28 TRINITY_DN3862_c0_g3_i1:131-1399(-)
MSATATCKALHQSTASILTATVESIQRMDQAHNVIDSLNVELIRQYQVCHQLCQVVFVRQSQLIHGVFNHNQQQNQLIDSLNSILSILKSVDIDANFASKDEQGNVLSTLYDFVDTQSVNSLISSATQFSFSIAKMSGKAQTMQQNLQSRFQALVDLFQTSPCRIEIKPAFSQQVHAMKTEMTQIGYHTIKVQRMEKALNDGVDGDTEGDEEVKLMTESLSSSLQSELSNSLNLEKEINGLMAKVISSHQTVTMLGKDVQESTKQYTIVYKNCRNLQSELKEMTKYCKSQVEEVAQLEAEFIATGDQESVIFEEMANLVQWYQLFHDSYTPLVAEVHRRHIVLSQHQQLINHFTRELKLLKQLEQGKRDEFFQQHGRFLPSSLCPAIMEPIPNYTVEPNPIETSLPVLNLIREPTQEAEEEV